MWGILLKSQSALFCVLLRASWLGYFVSLRHSAGDGRGVGRLALPPFFLSFPGGVTEAAAGQTATGGRGGKGRECAQ